MAAKLAGLYFDGVSARAEPVELEFLLDQLVVQGPSTNVRWAKGQTRLEEPVPGAPCVLVVTQGEFAGGRLELPAPHALGLLKANGYSAGWFSHLHRSMLGVLLCMSALIAGAYLGYTRGLPAAGVAVAKALPQDVMAGHANRAWAEIDNALFKPSQLPAAQQALYQSHLADLQTSAQAFQTSQFQAAPLQVTLLFRQSPVLGANAFALANNTIVLTDELIELLNNEQAVIGVLAHELGHLQQRHAVRHLVQNSVVGAVSLMLLGDVSYVVAAAGAGVLGSHYSRNFEREADQFAIDLFVAQGRPLTPLKILHQQLNKLDGEKEIERDKGLADYLGSHPNSNERLALIEQAEQRLKAGGADPD